MGYVRVSIDTSVDVDIYEFLDSCDNNDIEEIIRYINSDRMDTTHIHSPILNPNILEIEWYEKCNKLESLRLRISMEDEEKINEILNKY